MITLEKAIEIIHNRVSPFGDTEQVTLADSLHRILARDVVSDINMPPFRKTAVDGYACRMQDINSPLTVIETIAAGAFPKHTIAAGTCAKIMTGAPVPEGADCVLPVEDTLLEPDGKIRYKKQSVKSNICELGEDIQTDAIALKKGTPITPRHIAIMAALGCHNPVVSRMPGVAILPTGNELVEPDIVPTGGQIRNSNGHQLIAQVKEAGAHPNYYGIVKDSKEATRQTLKKALEHNDMVLLTGGVSMGDYDFVPEIMEELGITIHFDSIAVQPGRPTTFGTAGNKIVFGLPGNPVSSFIQFELLVKLALNRLTGNNNPTAQTLKLPLAKDYLRKRSARMSLIPVTITENQEVTPVNYNGSAHIFALGNATAIASIPIGTTELKKGELVDVRPL